MNCFPDNKQLELRLQSVIVCEKRNRIVSWYVKLLKQFHQNLAKLNLLNELQVILVVMQDYYYHHHY